MPRAADLEAAAKAQEQAAAPFGVQLEHLKLLHENREKESISELGGVEGIATALQTDLRLGIDPISEQDDGLGPARIAAFGSNVIPPRKRETFLKLFLDTFKDTTIIILAVAAVVSLILGLTIDEHPETGWIEGVAILAAVLAVSMVTAANDYSKETQFRRLESSSKDIDVRVIRGGEMSEISVHALVVGDVVVLETGDQVPADGVFISGHDLATSEAVMTGETGDVAKSVDAPFLLSGCQVSRGLGNMLVTGVGVNSQWGQLFMALKTSNGNTPLQDKLDGLAKTIGKGGTAVAIGTFTMLLILLIVGLSATNTAFGVQHLPDLVLFFAMAVTIVVVAVPEGLPLAVTLSLAYSVRKMLRDNNLVRKLAACETMGGATQICSDKTGTLTENKMAVTQALMAGKHYLKVPASTEISSNLLSIFHEGVALNSTAFLSMQNNMVVHHGNKTECALLELSNKLGGSYEATRVSLADQVVHKYAFNSAKKRMSTIQKMRDGIYRLHTKGAWEIVLKLCDTIYSSTGERTLSDAERTGICDAATTMASSGLRVICVAYRNLGPLYDQAWEDADNAPEERLTLLAIVGIKDPLRPEVPLAVQRCQQAGITVRMVTGDNILTASHIARECGILTTGRAIEGADFRNMSEEQRIAALGDLQVMARSTPTDKLLLVKTLKQQGEVVAVTGDGTNDAPALKEADVGFAMGISGTEVAKEACDIVILDDNFSSIVKAVVWGRSVFDNIRKFLQFQLTVNVVALAIAFLGAATGRGLPLRTVQLLWVNLIMDTMAALALGTEPPNDNVLLRKPYGRHEPLITRLMWVNILGQSAYQLAVLLTILYAGASLFGVAPGDAVVDVPTTHYTIVFNAFVMCQVFNEINSRKINGELNVFKGLADNHIFLAIILGTVVVQVLIVQLAGQFTWTAPLTAMQWIACVVIGLMSLPVGFLIRTVAPYIARTEPDPVLRASSSTVERLRAPHGVASSLQHGYGRDSVASKLDSTEGDMTPSHSMLLPPLPNSASTA